jgi:hypothetical protein
MNHNGPRDIRFSLFLVYDLYAVPHPYTDDARAGFLRSELERVLTLIRLAEDHRGRREFGEAGDALQRARNAIGNARVFVRMLKPDDVSHADLQRQLTDLQSAIDSF